MIKFIENGKIKIYVNESIMANSKTAVLLIHGLAEHSGRYDDFIKVLCKNNISVFAMDLRGHGQTISKKGDCQNINSIIMDVNLIVERIKTSFNFEKIGIFGHSIGGLVASIYANLYNNIDFLILSSPAIYCPKKLKIIKFIPYKILPFIYIKKRYSESKEMLEYSKNDKFACHKFSIRMVGVFFNDGIKLLNTKINISCPTLLVCGKKDRLLNEQDKFIDFFNKLPNNQNKFIAYEKAKHRIVQNEGCEKRIEDILSWIKNLNF